MGTFQEVTTSTIERGISTLRGRTTLSSLQHKQRSGSGTTGAGVPGATHHSTPPDAAAAPAPASTAVPSLR